MSKLNHGKFGTMLNCIDGRTQLPVINYLKNKYRVDFVDAINESGMDKILSGVEDEKTKWIKYKAEISVNKHNSKIIAIVGHSDCVGNPVEKETHLTQIKKSAELAKGWFPSVEVLGLFIDLKDGGNWEIVVL